MAQDHSTPPVADILFLSERTVMAHMRSVFNRPGLVDDGHTDRRVLAVVTFLEGRQG